MPRNTDPEGDLESSSANDPRAAVDVILPCLNEAAALPWVLERMPAGFRPIVIDNGSTDDTAEVAREYDALVVTEPRRGFGAACHAGLLAATSELVAFCDADASFDPGDLPLVADPVRVGSADLVLGRRRATSLRAWPPHARLANRVLTTIIRSRTGVALGDLGPMRAAPRAALLDLTLADRRFGYPLEMVIRAAGAGWQIVEVDVDYRPRTGKSKVTGTVRGTLRAVADMRRILAEQKAAAR